GRRARRARAPALRARSGGARRPGGDPRRSLLAGSHAPPGQRALILHRLPSGSAACFKRRWRVQDMLRSWVRFVLCVVCGLAARSALAESPAGKPGPAAPAYPSQPITAIVPFPAGGPTDVIMRLLAEPMGKALGQRI